MDIANMFNLQKFGATPDNVQINHKIASFGDDGGAYDQTDAGGFINLFGLPMKVKAMVDAKRENK